MIRFEGDQLAQQFKAAFGFDVDKMTPAQCRWLISLGKHIRGRCRSNAALKNYLAANFKGLRFSEVDREWQGRPYKALEITAREYVMRRSVEGSPAEQSAVCEDTEE